MKNLSYEQIDKAKRKAVRAFYNGLRYYDDKHKTYNPASRVENILEHCSDLLGLYGCEAYEPYESNPTRPRFQYINAGDTYSLTLVHDRCGDRFLITDIGTIIEREET